MGEYSVSKTLQGANDSSVAKNKSLSENDDEKALKSASRGAANNTIFNAISPDLVATATDVNSAKSKASKGATASERTLSIIDEIDANLNANTDSFTISSQEIEQSVAQYQNISTQGENQLVKAVKTVNSNGNLVGLNVNVKKTDSQNNNLTPSAGAIVEDGNQLPNLIAKRSIKPQSTEKADDEPKQVFSCDWGNGAKSVDEIQDENNSISKKPNNKVDRVALNRAKANELNSLNKKTQDEFRKLQADKKKELDKSGSTNGSSEDIQNQVKDDSKEVRSNDAKNMVALTEENNYLQRINSNSKAAGNYIQEATQSTSVAKSLGQSAADQLLSAAQLNEEAAGLFSSGDNKETAIQLAQAASQINGMANATSIQANDMEVVSQQKQRDALGLMKDLQTGVLPQYQQCLETKLSNNKAVLDKQNETKQVIENKENELVNNSNINDVLKNIERKEDLLLVQNSQNKTHINEFNNKLNNHSNPITNNQKENDIPLSFMA